MLIKVKKNLRGLFLHQITPFKLLGEKHIGKKFFWTTLLVKMLKTSVKKTTLLRFCMKEDVSSQGETKLYLVGL